MIILIDPRETSFFYFREFLWQWRMNPQGAQAKKDQFQAIKGEIGNWGPIFEILRGGPRNLKLHHCSVAIQRLNALCKLKATVDVATD